MGDFASALEKPLTGDFGLRRTRGGWRYGLGLSFGSFAMKAPYDDELEWGYQRIYLSGGRVFRADRALRPVLEARVGVARMHPRSELFTMDPLPPDFAIGDSPTKPGNGFHIGVMPGVAWHFSRSMGLDVSATADYHAIGEMDLSPVGQQPASSGLDWGARVGLFWETGGGVGAAAARPNEWGVRPSWGWALGEALAINFAASGMNEYVRNANFNQVSPRSWWSNVEDGFTYDDNEFLTNQFIHPFNGSQYYNAARSNGLGYWSSYAVSMTGALHWELAGETHPMSFNDLVATGVGGAALGEAQYRFSSMILDTEATGGRRLLREASAFLVDPIRGFNRILSGRAWQVRPNPSELQDTNPLGQVNLASFGWRRQRWDIDVDEAGKESRDTGFLEYYHQHGNVFDQERRGPFDYFTLDGQLNFGDKRKIGRLMIQGNWLTVPVGESEQINHMLALTQHFQYDNNQAYEYGGQSFGPTLYSRWGTAGDFALESRVDILATLMGAVNSDASELADVADQERIREYDYGPGGGGQAMIALTYRKAPLLTVNYKLHFLYTLNGSVYHESDDIGLDSNHWLHGLDARLDVPLFDDIAAGARFTTFTRESHYAITLPQELPPGVAITQLVKQSSPEFRVYLSYVPSVR